METATEPRKAGRPPNPDTITTMRSEIDELKKQLAAQKTMLKAFMEEVSAAMGYPSSHFRDLVE